MPATPAMPAMPGCLPARHQPLSQSARGSSDEKVGTLWPHAPVGQCDPRADYLHRRASTSKLQSLGSQTAGGPWDPLAARLAAWLPTCLPACLPACPPASRLACPPGCGPVRSPALSRSRAASAGLRQHRLRHRCCWLQSVVIMSTTGTSFVYAQCLRSCSYEVSSIAFAGAVRRRCFRTAEAGK